MAWSWRFELAVGIAMQRQRLVLWKICSRSKGHQIGLQRHQANPARYRSTYQLYLFLDATQTKNYWICRFLDRLSLAKHSSQRLHLCQSAHLWTLNFSVAQSGGNQPRRWARLAQSYSLSRLPSMWCCILLQELIHAGYYYPNQTLFPRSFANCDTRWSCKKNSSHLPSCFNPRHSHLLRQPRCHQRG